MNIQQKEELNTPSNADYLSAFKEFDRICEKDCIDKNSADYSVLQIAFANGFHLGVKKEWNPAIQILCISGRPVIDFLTKHIKS